MYNNYVIKYDALFQCNHLHSKKAVKAVHTNNTSVWGTSLYYSVITTMRVIL